MYESRVLFFNRQRVQVLLSNHLQCANMYMYLYGYKCVKKRYSQYLSILIYYKGFDGA